jgi:hypothetical protein
MTPGIPMHVIYDLFIGDIGGAQSHCVGIHPVIIEAYFVSDGHVLFRGLFDHFH